MAINRVEMCNIRSANVLMMMVMMMHILCKSSKAGGKKELGKLLGENGKSQHSTM